MGKIKKRKSLKSEDSDNKAAIDKNKQDLSLSSSSSSSSSEDSSKKVKKRRALKDAADVSDDASSVVSAHADGMPLQEYEAEELENRQEDVEEILGAVVEEESEGEELFGDQFEKDYAARPELDVYDANQLDQRSYAPLTHDQRRDAEQLMEQRAREERRKEARQGAGFGMRGPAALLGEDDFDDDGGLGDDDPEALFGMRRRRARRSGSAAGSEADATEQSGDGLHSEGFAFLDAAGEEAVALEARQGPLREWVIQHEPRLELLRRFRNFLINYPAEAPRKIYKERLEKMCAANRESLHVNYMHLSLTEPTLAVWLADAPAELLEAFDEALAQVVRSMFPHYASIRPDVHVRITSLPLCDSLRDLRENQLGVLVKVAGVLTRRTAVFPQLRAVKFDCTQCKGVLGPYYVQPGGSEPRLSLCPNCHKSGPFQVNVEQTVYRNYQRAMLQEAPGSVPPGRLPRTKELVLYGDLVDQARPGEAIEVTGIYRHSYDARLNGSNGFPVFSTLIEVNHINKKEDLFSSFQITEEDVEQIRALARDERIAERLFKSIAPSIYGHEDIKIALALAMFGGQPKNVRNKHRIRGDLNVLLLGDPGQGKSQFLKFVEKTAQRAVFTTGQGASSVGLTASVRKDALTGSYVLEGGALVLADRGVCCIDEFDKMNEHDRTSIHEAMEQQSISISKAGIVTTLQARCAVIAAANPIKGRYDASRSFGQNVELTEPILDRFDIMCVVRDIVDPVADERLARFVVGSHRRSHPEHAAEKAELRSDADNNSAADRHNAGDDAERLDPDIIPHDLLRKYITYAKRVSHPRIVNIDRDKIATLYSDLRRASMNGGGVPMGVRYLESIIRMAEAHARMHLRDYVREDDVNLAIKVMLNSFITSQKFSVARSMTRHFRKYLSYRRDNNELLLYILQEMVRQTAYYLEVHKGKPPEQVEIELVDFESRARELDISDLQPFFESQMFASLFQLKPGATARDPTLIIHVL